MNRYVITGFAVVALLMSGISVRADEALWGNDFELAKKQAAERGVPILAFFTGSDWCGWCKKLTAEVLSKDVFKTFAKENFVLFEADFPSRIELPEAVSRQNSKLQEKYMIRGFPTLLVLKPDGTETARTGYRRGGAKAYVEHLKSLGS